MTETTARLALPLLAPGQAQKEMTHNEALARLDLIAGASVVEAGLTAPPPAPAVGACWIVGDGASGAWAGHDRALAGWTEGGWRFVAPPLGTLAWVQAAECFARYGEGGWMVGAPLGAPRPPIAPPTGGATIDSEARATLAAILTLLQDFGFSSPI